MLERADLSLNIHCIRLLSRFGILPLQMNTETGKIRIKTSRCSTLRIWRCLIFTSQTFTFWIAWRVYLKYKLNPGPAMQTLPLDYMTLAPGQMCIWLAVMNFKRWPEATAEIFNGFIDSVSITRKSFLRTSKQRFWSRLTMIEMVTVVMPAIVFPIASCVIAVFEIVSTWPATRGLNVVLRIAITTVDSGTLVARSSWAYFSLLIILVFLGELSRFLEREKARLRLVAV